MSWHGAAVFVRPAPGEPPRPYYIDHIIENDNKQDAAVVCATLEAVVAFVHEKWPHLKQCRFQTDNASNYTGFPLVVHLRAVCQHHGLTLAGYHHSEPCQGKSVSPGFDKSVAATADMFPCSWAISSWMATLASLASCCGLLWPKELMPSAPKPCTRP